MHGHLGAESGVANVPPDLVQLVVDMVQAELPDRDVASDTLGELAAQPLSTSRPKPRRPGAAAGSPGRRKAKGKASPKAPPKGSPKTAQGRTSARGSLSTIGPGRAAHTGGRPKVTSSAAQ